MMQQGDLLHSSGLDKAKLFIIAIDGKEQITELVALPSHLKSSLLLGL